MKNTLKDGHVFVSAAFLCFREEQPKQAAEPARDSKRTTERRWQIGDYDSHQTPRIRYQSLKPLFCSEIPGPCSFLRRRLPELVVPYCPLVVPNGETSVRRSTPCHNTVLSVTTTKSCLHKNASYCPVSTESQHMLVQNLPVMPRLFGLQSLTPVQCRLHNVEKNLHARR